MLRLDALDAVHVLKVELELADDEPFHLVPAHAIEVLDDVHLGRSKGGKMSTRMRKPPHAAGNHGYDHHHHRDGVSERKWIGFMVVPISATARRTRSPCGNLPTR